MNTSIMHARSNEAIRPPSNDERRASWDAKYFCAGFHRRPEKPRIRVTVPAPLSPSEPVGVEADSLEHGTNGEPVRVGSLNF